MRVWEIMCVCVYACVCMRVCVRQESAWGRMPRNTQQHLATTTYDEHAAAAPTTPTTIDASGAAPGEVPTLLWQGRPQVVDGGEAAGSAPAAAAGPTFELVPRLLHLLLKELHLVAAAGVAAAQREADLDKPGGEEDVVPPCFRNLQLLDLGGGR